MQQKISLKLLPGDAADNASIIERNRHDYSSVNLYYLNRTNQEYKYCPTAIRYIGFFVVCSLHI